MNPEADLLQEILDKKAEVQARTKELNMLYAKLYANPIGLKALFDKYPILDNYDESQNDVDTAIYLEESVDQRLQQILCKSISMESGGRHFQIFLNGYYKFTKKEQDLLKKYNLQFGYRH